MKMKRRTFMSRVLMGLGMGVGVDHPTQAASKGHKGGVVDSPIPTQFGTQGRAVLLAPREVRIHTYPFEADDFNGFLRKNSNAIKRVLEQARR